MRTLLRLGVAAVLAVAAHGNADCTRVDFIPNPFGMDQSPVQGPCSGNGQCVSGVCICNEGWTGLADFFDTRGADCQINETITRILWGVNLLLAIVYYALSVPRIKIRWQAYQQTRATKLARGEKYGLLNNRGMLSIVWGFGLCIPAVACMGLLRIIKPSERVGFTFGATFLFAVAKVAFYSAVYFFQPALIASILRGQRATKRIVQVTFTISGVLSLMGVVAGFLPFITLYASNGRDDAAAGVWFGVMGLTALQVIGLGVQAYWTMVKVEKALSASYDMSKSTRTLKVKDALVAVERGNIMQAFPQSAIYLLFVLITPMFTVHDYFLPIGWMAYISLCKKVAFTAVKDSTAGSQTDTGTAQSFEDSNDKGFSSANETSAAPASPTARQAGPGAGAYPKGTVVRKFQGNMVSFADVQASREESQDDGYV